MDAARRHSAVIRAKTSVEVDQPDGHFKAPNAVLDWLIRRTGRDPSGVGWTSLDGTDL